MPLAAKSNERQLCSQAMKVSDGIFLPLPPLCLVVTETKLHCTVKPSFAGIHSNMETIITDSFLCPGGIKAIHCLDKIDPLNTDTLSWTVCPVLKVPILTSSIGSV